jgi:adsorption protein B
VEYWQALAVAARELALFAATGFLIGGLDDLGVDLIWIARTLWRRATVYRRHPRAHAGTLGTPRPGRLALFVPAWREDAVIGQMIARARATLRHRDWVLYVGCYPNDPATIAAVEAATRGDARIRLVVGDRPGPTTKAGCLNWLWAAMRADEAIEHRHVKAVILHDAEDAVHRDELAVYDALIDRFDLVQLPVVAVPVSGRGWWRALVSGTYCGEFAEAHGKQVVVREAVGAAVPSAGVGCAIGRRALAQAARGRDGPFDPETLTEDYEVGLRIGAAGGRGAFVRMRAADGRGIVAVRACFPDTIEGAARQKARWMAGIALAGWDRLGWQGGIAERWMRLRDRRAPIAAIVLACAYLAMLLWGSVAAAALAGLAPAPVSPLPGWAIAVNLGLLGWRTAWRAGFTLSACGWRMAALTPLHMVVGNVVAMAAAVRAIALYVGIVRHGRVRWDKTAHVFPAN